MVDADLRNSIERKIYYEPLPLAGQRFGIEHDFIQHNIDSRSSAMNFSIDQPDGGVCTVQVFFF